MSPLAVLAGAFVLAACLALLGAWAALRGGPASPRPSARTPGVDRLGLRTALGVGALAIVAVLTRWPVAAVVAGVAGFTAPDFGRSRARRRRSLERTEAVAAWAEMLRDVLGAGNGLEASVVVTAQVAPAAVEAELGRLAAAVGAGRDLVGALLDFAIELDDPMGDKVVAALVLAARRSPGHLADLLGVLAEVARDDVAMRRKVDAGRARIRTSMRLITGLTAGFSALVVAADADFRAAYGTLAGQVVLAVVVALFVGAHLWVERATGERRGERVLAGVDPTAAAAVVEEVRQWPSPV
ncbi:MAG TPA: type II secretion system F family protein [Acidimicrobiales bacterium]|nr:type II secretion system F family protein [Acidimicrobiales bacterium]